MPVAAVPAIHVKKQEPQVLVEYQRETGFPWMVAGFYRNATAADKAIQRLSRLMPGNRNFRTR